MQTHQLHRWQVNTMGARARLRTCEICHLSCTYFKSRRQYASVQEKAASKTTLALYSGGKQQRGSANHLIGRVSKSFRESRIHIFQTSFLLHSHIHLSSECAKYYKDGCTLQSGCSCRERKTAIFRYNSNSHVFLVYFWLHISCVRLNRSSWVAAQLSRTLLHLCNSSLNTQCVCSCTEHKRIHHIWNI